MRIRQRAGQLAVIGLIITGLANTVRADTERPQPPFERFKAPILVGETDNCDAQVRGYIQMQWWSGPGQRGRFEREFTIPPRFNPPERLRQSVPPRVWYWRSPTPSQWNRLGLSTEQRERIGDILARAARERFLIMTDPGLSPRERLEKLMALRQKNREEIGAVLTPEQKDKLRSRMPGRRMLLPKEKPRPA